ncbi:ABC transporter substrate-binding protein [Paenibacillus aceti]|uniref:ABC transporter substrate-binding protein n=1 Tax=Paenibacillus aceti TaxID=1820010 RepID=A0ABQ1W8S8_9BACL|nr:extracellular solute-binding protein [Paenibacillus aceti]GGG19443.1 ABC transporter substrate-binding protein [Paenibacillus aceti]
MRGKIFHKIALLAISCVLVAGCSSGAGKKVENTKSTLKVVFYDESWFYQQYGDLFTMKNGENIEFQVVSTQGLYSNDEGKSYDEAFDDLIEKEKPDVLMLGSDNFERYINDGKLVELDPYIEKEKYNLEGIYPGLIDMLKEIGGSKLYGLTPSFYGNAVFYNKDLFDKYGVEAPHEGMSWQDILDLARRFPTDGDEKTRVYGYGDNYPLTIDNLISNIANSEGLMNVNTETMKVTVDTDSWKRVFQLAIDTDKAGVVFNPKGDEGFTGGSMEDYYQSQPFLMGRAAITVGYPYMLQNLKEAKERLKDYKSFELGIVSGPIDPADPTSTYNSNLNDIFAINSASPNKDAAWDFIKFVNGEDYARVKSRSGGDLMTRMGFKKEIEGQSLDPFYALKPKMNKRYRNMDKLPDNFMGEYNTILNRELELVKDNKKTLDEALKVIQSEAQTALDKGLKEKEANKGKEGAGTNDTDSGVVVTD